MNAIFAGASFPCGVAELGQVAHRHGFNPMFIDHPHLASMIEPDLSPLMIEDRLPEGLADEGGLFLPLLESWVSEGRRSAERCGCRFDQSAARISRSKALLTSTLAEARLEHVQRQTVKTIDEALEAATTLGYPVVLRADSGYSGRGVWVASSADELRTCWSRQSNERVESDFAEMRLVLDMPEDVSVVEPLVQGDEWSVDAVVGAGGTYVLRVCEKATAIIAGRPVTLGYRLTDSVELIAEMSDAVRRWSGVLFQPGTISFACFDVRRHRSGRLVPLDFGVRLGGDCIPYLVRRAGHGTNPYAAALDAALACDPQRLSSFESGHALVHVFATQAGRFDGISFTQTCELVSSRRLGFAIEQRAGMPVHRRVGTVLTKFVSTDAFRQACESSSEWAHVVIG